MLQLPDVLALSLPEARALVEAAGLLVARVAVAAAPGVPGGGSGEVGEQVWRVVRARLAGPREVELVVACSAV